MATVVLVGTLDTKGAEYEFVKQRLLESGVTPLVIDVGVLSDPPFSPDISASEVARAAGASIEEIRFAREGSDTRARAIATMARGAAALLARLREDGRCDAVLGMGGSGGSTLISQAMQAVPLGVPKLLVSTMMAGDVKGYVDGRDLAMMHSVTDIAGLNRFSRRILANAAYAAAGMAQHSTGSREETSESPPLIALTMFGITTPAVLRIRAALEERGFETVVFHAVGSGGRAMETMIDEGLIDGVVDCTLAELCAHALGGIFDAGPDRLTAAGRRGIPQVIVPGAMEVLNFGPRETLPARFDDPERKLIIHNPNVCAVKATADELRELGQSLAAKANAATGPTAILLPLGGLDKYEEVGGPWHDPATDRGLFETIRANVRKGIPVIDVDANINEPAFSDAVLETFGQLWSVHSGGDSL